VQFDVDGDPAKPGERADGVETVPSAEQPKPAQDVQEPDARPVEEGSAEVVRLDRFRKK
jgi:hypothetical protein